MHARRLPFAQQGGGNSRDEWRALAARGTAHDARGLGVGAEHRLGRFQDRLAQHEVYYLTVELVCFGRGNLTERATVEECPAVCAACSAFKRKTRTESSIAVTGNSSGRNRINSALSQLRPGSAATRPQSQVTDPPVIAPAHAACSASCWTGVASPTQACIAISPSVSRSMAAATSSVGRTSPLRRRLTKVRSLPIRCARSASPMSCLDM